jgi:hypothetical protein
MMKRATRLGRYLARAAHARIGSTSDGVCYVEIDFAVERMVFAPPQAVRGVPVEGPVSGEHLRWRGWYTRGGVHRAVRVVATTGGTLERTDGNGVAVDDPTSLDGVGSRSCLVDVVRVECDDAEAAGAHRMFVTAVEPVEGAGR